MKLADDLWKTRNQLKDARANIVELEENLEKANINSRNFYR